MYLDRNDELDALLATVRRAGGDVTDAFAAIVDGWSAPSPDFVALYMRGVCENDASLRERALALAVANGVDAGELRTRAAKGVADALIRELKITNKATYSAAAKDFDFAAKALADSHAVASVDSTAEDLARPEASKAARLAWAEQPQLAADLTAAYERLLAAAQLAGVAVGRTDSESNAPTRILLCIDTAGQHRRKVHEAWAAKGHRLGRWGTLISAGIPLRALPADKIAGAQPYAAPEEPRTVNGVLVDPADFEYRGEPLPEPVRDADARRLRTARFNHGVLANG